MTHDFFFSLRNKGIQIRINSWNGIYSLDKGKIIANLMAPKMNYNN